MDVTGKHRGVAEEGSPNEPCWKPDMPRFFSRRILRTVTLFVIMAFVGLWFIWSFRAERVTSANYDVISRNMTRTQVEAVLGRAWSGSILEPPLPLKGILSGTL